MVEPTQFEKYARQIGFIFPKVRVEHEKYLKPPPPRIFITMANVTHTTGYNQHKAPYRLEKPVITVTFLWAREKDSTSLQVRRTPLKTNMTLENPHFQWDIHLQNGGFVGVFSQPTSATKISPSHWNIFPQVRVEKRISETTPHFSKKM